MVVRWPTSRFALPLRPLLSLLVIAATAASQTPARDERRFEVASIRPSRPDAGPQDARFSFTGSRFEALNATLGDVLFILTPTPGLKIEGGPGWATSERFDIVAKTDDADGVLAPEQRNSVVLHLLEDRFKLAFHREQKEAPGLELVAGKKAPSLDTPKDGEKSGLRAGTGRQNVFTRRTMYDFALVLSNMLHVPVVDHTGIKGEFDFILDPDKFATSAAGERFDDLVRAAVEDMGFRLESSKTTVDRVIIDHAERPGEN